MLNYIRKTNDNKLYISEENSVHILDMPFKRYVNIILRQKFNNVDTLEATTKRILNYKAKVPLYIDSNTLLMCIKSYRLENSLYINYFAMTKYEFVSDYVFVTFLDFHVMKLFAKKAFIKQLEKSRMILEYSKN